MSKKFVKIILSLLLIGLAALGVVYFKTANVCPYGLSDCLGGNYVFLFLGVILLVFLPIILLVVTGITSTRGGLPARTIKTIIALLLLIGLGYVGFVFITRGTNLSTGLMLALMGFILFALSAIFLVYLLSRWAGKNRNADIFLRILCFVLNLSWMVPEIYFIISLEQLILLGIAIILFVFLFYAVFKLRARIYLTLTILFLAIFWSIIVLAFMSGAGRY
jgi:hypothetical protein